MTDDERVPNPPTWRLRLAKFVLFGGLALALLKLVPSMPREQILLFRIEGSGVVKRLNATWTALGKSEPAGGVSLVMTQPSRVVRQPLSVPNGSYVLEISVERAPDVNDDRANEPAQRDSVAGQAPSKVGSDVPREPSQTTYVRRVTLEGGETVVRL